MKTCVLFLLVVGSVYSAPVEQGGIQAGSCEDPSVVSAAHLALSKINLDRVDGYVFSLHRLSNVHLDRHGENGVVYYLNLDVVETNCSVLSRRDWKKCEQVYGQCKAAIYINKPHRVVRLYKYDCVIRPPSARVTEICPDCSTFIDFGNEQVQKAVSQSLEKFNNESGLNNHFALLKILRASAGHKGFCKASLMKIPGDKEDISVECEIYEQEHDHIHDHTKDHSHHDVPHPDDSKHHHTHDHNPGSAYRHGHAHSHDHGLDSDHDHVHAYHAKARNHTGGFPNQHHNYSHPEGTHTHEHDHELALDHDHKHAHLHEHEHHHHHHLHEHEAEPHDEPEGLIRTLPAIDQPMILPSFPDVPAGGPKAGVTLPLRPDPSIPGQTEPTILPFPTSRSAECANPPPGASLVNKLFTEDPLFKPAA
uniref:Cystatin domain-containing protein n=1 Tax=Xiphophorus couchianus TaxID=32473 RepID=A0A3B5L2X5_9TELE